MKFFAVRPMYVSVVFSVVTVAWYTTSSTIHSPFRGQSSPFPQLHFLPSSGCSVVSRSPRPRIKLYGRAAIHSSLNSNLHLRKHHHRNANAGEMLYGLIHHITKTSKTTSGVSSSALSNDLFIGPQTEENF